MAARKSKLRGMDGQDFDEEFEKFMNEPISDDSHSVVSPRYKTGNSIERSQTIESLKASDEFPLPEKSLDKSPPPIDRKPHESIPEESESFSVNFQRETDNDNYKSRSTLDNPNDIGISKDSLDKGLMNESYSGLESSKSDVMQLVNKYAEQTLHGMDTLEEIADKERFFRNLAAEVSGTLDFSQLNKALDEANSDKEASDDVAGSGPEIASTARPGFTAESKETRPSPGLQRSVHATQPADHPDDDEGRIVIQAGTLKESSNRILGQVDPMESITSSTIIRSSVAHSRGARQQEVETGDLERPEMQPEEVRDLSSTQVAGDDSVGKSCDHQESDYSSDATPPESLRSIKEIARIRIERAKEEARKGPGTRHEKTLEEIRKGSESRPLNDEQDKKDSKPRKSKLRARRRDSKASVSSGNSSRTGSVDRVSETPDNSGRLVKKSSNLSKLSSGKHVQSDLSRLPTLKKPPLEYKEMLSTKTAEIARERQLQTELYELRAEFNKLMAENDHLHKDFEQLKRVSNEKEVRLRHEFEVDMLQQKVATLEKQLKKAQELRIRNDSMEDVNEESLKEIERLQKELNEQELLLNGYQLENERLFKEIKKRDNEKRTSQSNLVEENQRLKSTLSENDIKRARLTEQVGELQRMVEQQKAAREQQDPSKTFLEKLKLLEAENTALGKDLEAMKNKEENDGLLIRDLERQRKEMERIIRRRYPDGIPDLLQRKEDEPKIKDEEAASEAINFLESKLKRLERELDGKDEEADKRLLNAELRHKEMAQRYEQHIASLQKRLLTIERRGKSPRGKVSQDDTTDNANAGERRKSTEVGKWHVEKERERTGDRKEEGSLLQASERKEASRRRELQKENLELKVVVDDLRMDLERERKKHSTLTARLEAECSQIRLDCRAEIEDVESRHLEEKGKRESEKSGFEKLVKRLQNDKTKLERDVTDQDVIIEQLKQRLLQSDVDKKLLRAAKVKEEALNSEVAALQKKLDRALECQPPEQQHFRQLEWKIAGIQQRQADREGELHRLLRNVERPLLQDGRDSHWRTVVEEKNEQIKQFREELDSILNIMKHMVNNETVTRLTP